MTIDRSLPSGPVPTSTDKVPIRTCSTMAGPPPQNLPLQERLMHLAKTLQFAWFIGHVSLLVCTLRYGLSYITFHSYSRWARVSYRTAFVAAAVTYGIVVYKGYRARIRQGKQTGALALLTDENVQYLGIALPRSKNRSILTCANFLQSKAWLWCGFSPAKFLSLSYRLPSTPPSTLRPTLARPSSRPCSLPKHLLLRARNRSNPCSETTSASSSRNTTMPA